MTGERRSRRSLLRELVRGGNQSVRDAAAKQQPPKQHEEKQFNSHGSIPLCEALRGFARLARAFFLSLYGARWVPEWRRLEKQWHWPSKTAIKSPH